MPGEYCFLCASDEGVFLDVTPGNRGTFGDQVETCLSIEIDKCIDLSNKICYKCAYELDQCAKFVQKYKKSHEVSEPKSKTLMSCCFLCYESVDSDRIFDITRDNNVKFNPLRKIRSIFNDDIKKDNDLKLICLTCRYNLDVLYDLKRIHQETIVNLKALINEEINYSNFPKVHTDVVNRKTTITTFPDVTFYGTVNSSDSESNEEDMALGKRYFKGRKTRSNAQIKLRNNKSKVRNCHKCYNEVASGVNMYRFYHTGLTVCKNCWITIDPSSEKTRRSRQIQSNLAKTKLCTVLLTDVLSQESYRKKKIYKMKKNKDDMSCDSSQEEVKSSESSLLSVSSKTRNHIVNGKARGKKRKIDTEKSKDDVDCTPSKVTRLSKECTNEIKASVDAEQQSTSTYLTRRRGRKRVIDDRSSDSDVSLEQRETRRDKLNDRVNKTNRKKQKSSLEETTSNAYLDSSDETSNEDGMSLRSKAKDAMSSSTVSVKKEKEERDTRSRTRSSSVSSVEISPTEFKSPKSLAQSDIKTKYTCDKCNKKFDTKLSSAKHELTHLKQAALKLEKLTVSSIKEKQETEVDSQDDKISKKAASRSHRIISADKHIDDPSEEVAINIEDDTDDTDEEIFSLAAGEKVKKRMKNVISEDEDDIIDKSDTTRSELHEEESANNENIETKESKQCEKSTVMQDETVIREDDKNGKDEDITDEHITEDKDSIDRNSDKSTGEDAQKTVAAVEDYNADEEKDKEIENDTRVSSIEKENTLVISECNNDEEDLQEETMYDNETIRSPILSLFYNTSEANNDHSESCENNLENNCEGDDEIIEDPEIPQCDLMDESSKKEPEEEVRKILPTDQIETLNDKRDLDDTIVNEDKIEELEKWQDNENEENMEIDIIADVDKPNSAEDTIEPDLTNGEKHDEIKDSDKDDIVVDPINSDSNDDIAKYKKITKETDDLKEKTKLEEEIKELEELVDDSGMHNKHRKIQENLTYLDNNSADAANEILKEVFELAATEVQQREEIINTKNLDEVEIETLENITREIRKSADMPSLDPISAMEIDDDLILN